MLIEAQADIRACYERALATRTGAQDAIAFGFARTALRAILLSLGIRPGGEVVLSPLTCKVVPLTLLSLDLKPVYADICADTLNLDPQKVAEAVRPATQAVLFQHTYGTGAGLEEVASAARQAGIPLIEDCAQCLPWAEPGESIGTTGAAAIFSNNLTKPLPAGSGGVAVTNDERMAVALRQVRDALPSPGHGFEARRRLEAFAHHQILRPALYWPLLRLYSRISPAYRARPVREEIASEILGVGQTISSGQIRDGVRWMARVDALAAHSRACSRHYAEALRGTRGLILPAPDSHRPLYWFPVLTPHKQELLREARRRSVEIVAWPRTTPIYPVVDPTHLGAYGYQPGLCPGAEAIAAQLMGLPTHEKITAAERMRIIYLLRELQCLEAPKP